MTATFCKVKVLSAPYYREDGTLAINTNVGEIKCWLRSRWTPKVGEEYAGISNGQDVSILQAKGHGGQWVKYSDLIAGDGEINTASSIPPITRAALVGH